jgi:cytochrome b561/polyisoprenoid-binding protein YceI
MNTAAAQRYSAVAIVLHWAIAVSILYMIPLGFWMAQQTASGAVGQGLFSAFQLHKSIGLTILLLSLIRLGWRLTHKPPPLPAEMPAWEKFAALATHWAFYFIIIAMPLTGWLYVSTQWSAPTDSPLPVATHYFGLFRVPALFGLPQADEETRKSLSHLFLTWHWAIAWTTVGLFFLHVAAALKHHFINRDETLTHMIPGLRAPNQTEPPPRDPTRLAILGGGLSLVAVAAVAMLYAASGFLSAAQSAPPQTTSTFVVNDTTTPAPPTLTTIDPPTTATPAAATTTPAPAAASTWRVNTASSSIAFGFTYNDEENGPAHFDGRFSRWRADIRFDPNDLAHSTANVSIETASASDGVAIHDQYLPTAEWFNAAANPTATFRTTSIARRGQGYVAQGTLTIKGQSRPVSLPFTLTINGNHASMRGTVSIDRHAFGIGNGSDGDEQISPTINIAIRVEAERGS